jgi:squalene-associated FAD-dependent desaturase
VTSVRADRAAAPRPKVAVVGGGLAGIAAALACADAGAAVTLHEARSALGGVASSQQRGEVTIDTGQHVFLRCCTAYRAFLDRIGGSALTSLQDRMELTVLRPHTRPARLRRSTLPAPLHLGWALARYRLLSPAERLAAARAALAARGLDPADPALDAGTLGAWLAGHGQSERAISRLWDLFMLSTLNARAPDANLGLAATVLRVGLLDRADAGDIGMSMVPLARLHSELAEQALTAAGVDVRPASHVRALEPVAGGWNVCVSSTPAEPADAVVLAVPHDRVRDLLPPGALADTPRFETLGASPIVNVHVVFDRPVTNLVMAAAVDSPVQWVFDRTRATGLRSGQYLAVSLSAAAEFIDEPVENLRRIFLPALSQLFPVARSAAVDRFAVTREPRATFRQCAGSGRLRPGAVTQTPGLYLAGAWTDTGWPATMEGAVRSGATAARAAMAAMGQEQPHLLEVSA